MLKCSKSLIDILDDTNTKHNFVKIHRMSNLYNRSIEQKMFGNHTYAVQRVILCFVR